MKRLFSIAFALFLGLGLLAQDASAARLGGGRSFGMTRNSAPIQKAAPAPAAPTTAAPAAVPATPAAAPMPAPRPSGMSRWLGPIAGLAAGLGLAALLSHFGMGEGMANVLMIMLLVVAVVFVFRLLFRQSQSPRPGSLAGATAGNAPMRFEPSAAPVASAAAVANTPADFDLDGFLRQAKLSFIRLQAANDAGNLDDLKQFLAPEVFAEVQLQYDERHHAKQETDVQQLDAEMLELVTENDQHVASVRFSGTIRDGAGPATSFAEIWHLVKPVSGDRGWQVAGIQQIQ
jgi:predicted lipid-binding transport protein (Tim44 family)